MNLGQPNLGLDKAPKKLIEGGLLKLLGGLGWRVKQIPPIIENDVRYETESSDDLNAKNCLQVGKVSYDICRKLGPECTGKNFPLILGGDHCIAIGTISAIKARRPETAVVWVDAHADINTPDTSGSGNMHGMPVAFLMGLVKNAKNFPGFDWFKPCLDPKDIVYIGLRDLDQGEKKFIKELGIKAFTMYDIDRLGIGKVMEESLAHLGEKPIHLSFDIDAIDPFYAPHTGTAVTGGITFREGNYICEALSASGRLTSMELVEVDPSQHKDVEPVQTISVALTLIGSALGQKIL